MGLSSTFVSAVLVVALVAPLTPRCYGFGLKDLFLPAITDQVKDLWRNGDVDLVDHSCSYSVKPDIQGIELYFIGSVTCPGWTTIRGESNTRSKSGVLNAAIKDFIQKALKAGLVTEEEAKPYLV
ncbi:anti-lipopolysaccharide factor-like [Penaeus monodon]|uniref:Anti-lipopolysaccharide factor 8 n=1 Tax=Penaeus monodon TaxID=6687 RepID=A0A6F8UPT9_PENMO|nr:anti-lipopolysaccharide factor-like [Penaeus monodon]BCB17104.1 anti-lipopolysaccharide factor 8 [Penaeus monodon]